MLHINLDLTQAEKLERRRVLDSYAAFAQVSVLAPLLTIALLRLLNYLSNRVSYSSRPEDLSSPERKAKRRKSAHPLSLAGPIWWRIFSFWLTTPSSVLGIHLGNNLEIISAVLWVVWLTVLTFAATDLDYVHVTKRVGIVGASQLPFHYLLAVKSRFNPVTLLTGQTWEHLNVWHRNLGRIMILFFIIHGSMYLNLFVQIGNLQKRVKDWDVILGLITSAFFLTLGTSSLAIVRRASYRVFILLHVLLGVFVLPAAWLHVSHLRIFIYQSAAIYLVGILLRAWDTHSAPSPIITRITSTSLVHSAASTPLDNPASTLRPFALGQHVYLVLARTGVLPTSIARNPFTIASLPSDPQGLSLLSRTSPRGNTAALLNLAQNESVNGWGGDRTPTNATPALRIEGPYGRADHVQRLTSGCDRVLFLAGGVGASFTLPLFRAVVQHCVEHRRALRAEMVWAVRRVEEARWIVRTMLGGEEERALLLTRLKVYVTGESGSDAAAASGGREQPQEGTQDDERVGDEVEDDGLPPESGIELVTPLLSALPRSALSREDRQIQKGLDDITGVQVLPSRPDIKNVVDAVFSHGQGERVGVYVCGPRGMGAEARRAVAVHVRAGREVLFWSEEFGLA